MLAAWEITAAVGPALPRCRASRSDVCAVALVNTLVNRDFYWNLGVTTGEIGAGLAIGSLAGLVTGMVLGANRLLGGAYEPYLYYLGPTPKIIFFPVLIMWFGVGPASQGRDRRVCLRSFPSRFRPRRGCGKSTEVLIRVGKSFRANVWQMTTKIYLPAMRHPIVNGVRLGLGVALISALLARTKLSNRGVAVTCIISRPMPCLTCRACMQS